MNELVNYIFSVGFANSIVRMSTPLIFVSMAAVLGAKANILCIAYEGMMLFAALGGVIGSAVFQSLLLGMLCGILAGSIIAGLFAYFVLVLKTKDMLVGLALNTLGSGGTIFTLYMLSGQKGSSISMSSLQFPSVTVPVIKDIPVLGEIFSGHNLLTYLAYLSVALVYIFLYKTPRYCKGESHCINGWRCAGIFWGDVYVHGLYPVFYPRYDEWEGVQCHCGPEPGSRTSVAYYGLRDGIRHGGCLWHSAPDLPDSLAGGLYGSLYYDIAGSDYYRAGTEEKREKTCPDVGSQGMGDGNSAVGGKEKLRGAMIPTGYEPDESEIR